MGQETPNDHPKLHTRTAIWTVGVVKGAQQFPFVQADGRVDMAEPKVRSVVHLAKLLEDMKCPNAPEEVLVITQNCIDFTIIV